MYVCEYTYIYIYIERERERENTWGHIRSADLGHSQTKQKKVAKKKDLDHRKHVGRSDFRDRARIAR